MNAKKRDAFIQRRFYTQNLLHINTFTHRRFHTETFFMHTHTQTHFHTETFTRKHFNTQTLLYTDSFTHIRFHMQMPFYRRTHTFTHKRFYTQTLLHTDTDAFPHRPFYTQTLLHTNTFTHIRFYTRTLLHAMKFRNSETCIFVRLLSKQCHDMLDFKTKLNGTKLNGAMIPVVFFCPLLMHFNENITYIFFVLYIT